MTGRRIAGAMLAVTAIVAGCGPPARESAPALPDEVVTTEAEPARVRPTRRPRFHHPRPSSARADFDGDGLGDAVRLRADRCGTRRPLCTFVMRVAIEGSGLQEFPFRCRSLACAIEGPSDFDDDGRSELVVELGPGAVVDYWGAYRVGVFGVEPLGFADPAYGSLDPPTRSSAGTTMRSRSPGSPAGPAREVSASSSAGRRRGEGGEPTSPSFGSKGTSWRL